MTTPLLPYAKVETAPSPTASVIWMHGIGDHGSSFVPLVREFDLSGCPPIRFIFPHAPEQPITAYDGVRMSAWFDMLDDFDSDRIEDGAGVQQSRECIERLIGQEKARGVTTERIILAGFSQGCAMALETGLCYPEKLGGIIALSGYIPLLSTFKQRYHPANKDTPVFLAHGSYDEVVPVERAKNALKALNDLGQNVEWREYPMPHTIDFPEINDIAAWLRKQLA
ncbi:MAG: carboxylesterase [Burkholderiaceae bacterium]|nr:carboxylesterase [Burkholderiaceae bacterium]